MTSEVSNGASTVYKYDAAGSRTYSSASQKLRSRYDAHGRLIHLTQSGYVEYQFAYDAVGREVLKTFPDQSKSLTTYDAMGRRLRQVYQKGYTTTDRMVQEHRHDLAGNLRWSQAASIPLQAKRVAHLLGGFDRSELQYGFEALLPPEPQGSSTQVWKRG